MGLEDIEKGVLSSDAAVANKVMAEDRAKKTMILTHAHCFGHGEIPPEQDCDDPNLRYLIRSDSKTSPLSTLPPCLKGPTQKGCEGNKRSSSAHMVSKPFHQTKTLKHSGTRSSSRRSEHPIKT